MSLLRNDTSLSCFHYKHSGNVCAAVSVSGGQCPASEEQWRPLILVIPCWSPRHWLHPWLGARLAQSLFLQKLCVSKQKQKLCRNLLVSLVWSLKVNDPKASPNLSVLSSIHSAHSQWLALQLPLCINVLCGLKPYKDLAVKTTGIIKGLFLKESFHKNAFETMQVGYFWNTGTRATCFEFLSTLYREAVTSSDSKTKTKTTSSSNYSLETV